MAEAVVRLPDRLLNPRNELHDIGNAVDLGLDHRKLVAAKPRHQIGLPDAALQTFRHDLQEVVAHMMAERIVDALELVNVDVKQRELLAPASPLQFTFD